MSEVCNYQELNIVLTLRRLSYFLNRSKIMNIYLITFTGPVGLCTVMVRDNLLYIRDNNGNRRFS